MNSSPMTILVIEDEVPIRRFLRPAIEAAGYRLVECGTGKDGILQASQAHPGLVILDLGLPDIDGLEVIKQIREWSKIPIIILSARGIETQKVAALDAGADDYIQKPFGVAELMARIRVALRHYHSVQQTESAPIIQAGQISIDLTRREVRRNGALVHLTPLEYQLLTTLVKHSGLVMTQRQLLHDVWGPGHADESHYLRIYMRQLRQKLEDNPANPQHLITEAGVGYRFRVE
ncbi:MAG: KDP operon transcriptional regulatory protein KdpE [Phycisphaerae bacterium]|nr:KDP operon transcriptional regulatory protein KdpE [Phycisphaerae bacterium]